MKLVWGGWKRRLLYCNGVRVAIVTENDPREDPRPWTAMWGCGLAMKGFDSETLAKRYINRKFKITKP